MANEIVHFDPAQWPRRAAQRMQESMEIVLRNRPRCSVMLTGGRSAERLYRAWSGLPDFQKLDNVDFYFGDERGVPPDSMDSNYGMAMRTLFGDGVPGDCTVSRMEGEVSDLEEAARRYEASLPQTIDLLLLGVGEDGHIASLFPGSAVLKEHKRSVVPVTAPKPPPRRLTITPRVIAAARRVFVLAPGREKADVLKTALAQATDISSMPIRLATQGEWLLDEPLSSSMPAH